MPKPLSFKFADPKKTTLILEKKGSSAKYVAVSGKKSVYSFREVIRLGCAKVKWPLTFSPT